MGRLIVVSFSTVDGVVEDPDGSGGTPFGGWAMRHGREAIAGDKFRLGPVLTDGTLLFGRRTWEHFATLWPTRDDEFARAMNAARKAVVTSSALDERAWSHSFPVDEPLGWVRRELGSHDVAVVGSLSVVAALADAGLVDEYRLLYFPTVAGSGRGLFPGPTALRTTSSEPVGPGTLVTLEPEPAGVGAAATA